MVIQAHVSNFWGRG